MQRRIWTNEETQWLIENYPSRGPKECAEYLEISIDKIRHKVDNLKLKYKPIKENEKKCLHCNLWQPLDNFFKSKNGRGGRHSYCKTCYNSGQRKRYSEDKVYRVSRLIRRRMKKHLTTKILDKFDLFTGCTAGELVEHLELQFSENISWDNKSEWHIDHIIPLCLIKQCPEKMYLLTNYRNLQPLPGSENSEKSDCLILAKQYLDEKISKFGTDKFYEEMSNFLSYALINAPP